MIESSILGAIKTLITLIVIFVSAVTSWVLGVRMRRRIKQTLGVDVKSDLELTSLNTWMRVENIEERNRGGRLQ